MAGTSVSRLVHVSGPHPEARHRAPGLRRRGPYRFFPRPRELPSMVGTPRGLEELPRPVAFGGFRGVFRDAVRLRAPRSEGVLGTDAPGDGPPPQDGHAPPCHRAARPHLDGPADPFVANRSQLLPESHLLERRLRAANA